MEPQDTVTLSQAVEIVYQTLLTRQGEVVTPELAMERARNIVAALQGLTIGGAKR